MAEKIITYNEVEYVAKLAKLELSEEQKDIFAQQLNDILSFFTKLKELDTKNIEPTSHLTTSSGHFREDIIQNSLPQDKVIGMTRYCENGYFRVPKIL